MRSRVRLAGFENSTRRGVSLAVREATDAGLADRLRERRVAHHGPEAVAAVPAPRDAAEVARGQAVLVARVQAEPPAGCLDRRGLIQTLVAYAADPPALPRSSLTIACEW